MKPTMMIVEEGPILLNLDVPKKGTIKFELMPSKEDTNIPKKQYLTCRRSSPTELLWDFSRKSSPRMILINTNIPKAG